MSMSITTKWDINLISPLSEIIQTIRNALACKDFCDNLEAVCLAISLCTAPVLFTHCIQWSYNSICEPQFHSRALHKRCLNLFAILMSTREPQSDTCQKHLLHFSCGEKKKQECAPFLFLFAVYNQRWISNLRPPFFQFPTCLLSVKS